MLISDLLDALNKRIDLSRAAAWDRVGLQIGGYSRPVGTVGVCHEATDDTVTEAIRSGVGTLVSYHPLLFAPTTTFIDGTTEEGRALMLARNGVSMIAVHTAFDAMPGGTSDALAAALGIESARAFGCEGDTQTRCIGRVGPVDHVSLSVFSDTVAHVLSTPTRTSHDSSSNVESVAVVPGSGSSFIEEASTIADVLVTGDIKHHDAARARDLGLALIDAGHIATERPGVEALYALVHTMTDTVVRISADPNPWKE